MEKNKWKKIVCFCPLFEITQKGSNSSSDQGTKLTVTTCQIWVKRKEFKHSGKFMRNWNIIHGWNLTVSVSLTLTDVSNTCDSMQRVTNCQLNKSWKTRNIKPNQILWTRNHNIEKYIYRDEELLIYAHSDQQCLTLICKEKTTK